ncbi:MAG TPA: magnesium-translocating P-type ATPase [Patescibacteria group bacterium]
MDLHSITKLTPEAVFTFLHSQSSGLSENEAIHRNSINGLNTLVEKDRFALLKRLYNAFFSPLVLMLLAASFIAAVLGDRTDFVIIASIVFLSGAITFYQHQKSENAVEKLKKKTHLTATVIRGGVEKEIPFSHITLGDIIVIQTGDLLPADVRLISQKDLSIDESTLTGESFPVEKSENALAQEKITLSQMKNICFAGTHVVTGEAKGVVMAIGKNTQLGHLSKELVSTKPQTAFDHDIQVFSTLIIRIIILLSIGIFFVNALLHHGLFESLLFAVALAVGLTPELMPVIITIALAKGALKMEKKDVIVKYLPSIQNLGSMNILCTDKTGTLTEGDVALSGYEDINGEKNKEILTEAIVHSSFDLAVTNPLNKATLNFPHNVNLHLYKKIDDIQFDFTRKRSGVVVEKNGKTFLICRGAVNSIVDECTHILDKKITKEEKEKILKKFQDYSKEGIRVLAIAHKNIETKEKYSLEDEKGLTFMGFLLYKDPIKSTVPNSVQAFKKLGINLKILTGDNEFITEKVCIDGGINVEGVLTGKDLEKLTFLELAQKAATTTIFARLSPEQKEEIIKSLKHNGNTVGYMGDGINDAPPLKVSDVGISVNSGADIAKDVADVVLTKKSLHVLKEGIIEGRKTHNNIFKYIIMSVSSNFGNMITVAAASFFLTFLPMLPIQIILLDFIYDLSQIALPQDSVDDDVIEKPSVWNMGLVKKFMLIFGPISTIFDFLTIGGLIFVFNATHIFFRTGWFVESLISQSLIVFAIRTKKVPFWKSKPSRFLTVSIIIGIIFGSFLPFSPFAKYFSFTPLSFYFFLFLAGIIFVYFTLVEIVKTFLYQNVKHT